MRHDGGAETRLILGAAWDVVALSVATGLSVLKPRRILARRDPSASPASPAGGSGDDC
jgi:hypothetical protein